MVLVDNCSAERSSGGFLGLVFADQGMLLHRVKYFGAVCFNFPRRLLRCRRHGSREDGVTNSKDSHKVQLSRIMRYYVELQVLGISIIS